MKPKEGKFVRISMTIMSCPICSFEQQVHITQKIKKCQSCHRNFKVPVILFDGLQDLDKVQVLKGASQ